jgi:hypothetical protein
MGAGGEWDITATDTVSNTPIYCHSDLVPAGQMYVTVVP